MAIKIKMIKASNEIDASAGYQLINHWRNLSGSIEGGSRSVHVSSGPFDLVSGKYC